MQSKKQEKEDAQWVKPQPCMICKKVIGGYYGSWEEGWTCSGVCEKVQAAKPRYPDHTEEMFLNRLGESNGSETKADPRSVEPVTC